MAIMDELFPTADSKDMALTKVMLTKYRKMRAIIADFERNGGDEKQEKAYRAAAALVSNIDRAYKLTIDDEAKQAIKYRYMDGLKYAVTVKRFDMADRTVDRRLLDGIESIANTLKLWGELG